MSSAEETRSDSAAAAPASRQQETCPYAWRRLVSIALRLVLLALFLNGLLGLLCSLEPGAAGSEVFSQLVHGDLWGIFLEPHSPVAALGALFSLSLPLVVMLLLGVGVLVGLLFCLRLAPLAALVLALALLRLTLRATGADLWGDLRQANMVLLLVPLVLYGVVLLIAVHRWGILLSVQGVHLGFRQLARLTMIGVFFNTAIPGAVGGDLLKMAYVARKAGARKTEAVLTIMLDRIVGILALFIVASVAVLLALPVLLQLDQRYAAVQAAALLIGLASLGGVVAVLSVECREAIGRLRPIRLIIAWARRLLPVVVVVHVDRLVQALDLYRRNRLALARAICWSILIHSLLSLGLFTIGRALGERAVNLGQYFLTTQVANTVAAIPVTPGGVGTRDAVTAAFLAAFRAVPTEKIGSIPVIMSLVIVFWGLIGAAVFVASPEARSQAKRTGPRPSRNTGEKTTKQTTHMAQEKRAE